MKMIFGLILISGICCSVVEAQTTNEVEFLSVKRKSLGRTKYFVNNSRVQRRDFEKILLTDSLARKELSDAKTLRLVAWMLAIGSPIVVTSIGFSEFPTGLYVSLISTSGIIGFASERKYHKSVKVFNAGSLGVEIPD